jgi:hypothetical protein
MPSLCQCVGRGATGRDEGSLSVQCADRGSAGRDGGAHECAECSLEVRRDGWGPMSVQFVDGGSAGP